MNICRICLKSIKLNKLKSIFCEISCDTDQQKESIENAIYFLAGIKVGIFYNKKK